MSDFLKKIEYFSRKLNAHKVGAYSAQTAFFMFFSFVPLIMLILSLLKLLVDSPDEIAAIANEMTPNVISDFLSVYLEEIMSVGKLSLTIVSAITLLWSASKGVFSIIGGLNSIYEIKEERNYFALRFLAVFYTVAFTMILVAVLLLMVFGKTISNFLYTNFPSLSGLIYVISSLRFIVGFVFLVLFFMVVYKALPSGKIRFFDQFPGAIVSSAGWVSFSIVFSFFINNFSNYSNIYGSLTAIIVLLLWLYICMYIMFFGAEVNLYLSAKSKSQND